MGEPASASHRPASAPPLLELAGIEKSYPTGDHRFVALAGVDLAIRDGEFVCLLGPSGCGKSTLLRIIAGLTLPTRGAVRYRGEQLAGVNPHASIVFQTFALFPWLTVRENVEIALQARGVPRSRRSSTASALLNRVGLAGFESAYPREISGGMRQKVGFARAMAVEPELLCLDEPFSALDVLSADALRGELLELWATKSLPTQAILMVTHNIEEAVLLADRVVVMAKEPGRVVREVAIELTQPRQRKDTAFEALVDELYAAVSGRPAPPASHLLRRLPGARPNALAGLLEKLAAEGGRAELATLASELVLELDDLLPIVEAGEHLGLLAVAKAGLTLTPHGVDFAAGSILARKELVAARLVRLPEIGWIFEALQHDDDHRIHRSFFLERLAASHGALAASQLELAVRWGRYAELFAYDDDHQELYLEP